MRIRVCSGWHPQGSKIYGRRFLASFDRFWPAEVELQVYTEEPEDMPRNACRSLWDIRFAMMIDEDMKADARFSGRVPNEKWKAKERIAGYSFRFDARKFWKQLVIPYAASHDLDDGDILIWLDGDVETTAPVPLDFVPSLLKKADLAFLGRGEKHSEIGFWAVRIGHETRPFLAMVSIMYTNGEFEALAEHHSAFVWDHVRKSPGFNLRENNLTRPGTYGHVWPHSVLASYMIHRKGNRKVGIR